MTPWAQDYAPDYKGEKEKFKIQINSGTRSFEFEHNKPVLFSKLPIRRWSDRDDPNVDYNATQDSIVDWLSGGPDGMRSPETAIYGIVQINIGDPYAMISEFAEFADGVSEEKQKKVKKEYLSAEQTFMKKVEEARLEAVKIATTKVRERLHVTHGQLMRQWDALEQDGKGRYAPSTTEAIGTYILSKEMDEISKENEERKAMVDRFKNLIKTNPII